MWNNRVSEHSGRHRILIHALNSCSLLLQVGWKWPAHAPVRQRASAYRPAGHSGLSSLGQMSEWSMVSEWSTSFHHRPSLMYSQIDVKLKPLLLWTCLESERPFNKCFPLPHRWVWTKLKRACLVKQAHLTGSCRANEGWQAIQVGT